VIGQRWGVSHDEAERPYPCDSLTTAAVLPLWRGVTVDVPPAQVWPWLCQLRLAPYSYDWLDNLGRRSPQQMRSLPDPRPGAHFSQIGGRRSVGRILAVAPGEHVTARIMSALMSYVLVPQDGSTRLLLKILVPQRPYAPLLAVGDWPMARRQLLNLKALAEAPGTDDPAARRPSP
jgi:hypothetical protein